MWTRIFNSFLLQVFLCLAISSPALAQILNFKSKNGSIILQNADSFWRDSDRKLMVLKGNVQIIFDQQHLSADQATIYEATQELEAEGNLIINSPTVYVEGERARLNYQTGQGVIYNGFVRSGQVVFEGRIVRKLGPEEYVAENAYYTACTTCPPAWSFTGSKIQATLGGYAYIKNSVIEFAHFPIFWLPYLIVPLKSERQTGFLTPTLDFNSNDGTTIGESFFWAISRSQDMTFELKNYSKRGIKGLANYRYVLSETSFGEGNLAMMHDEVFVKSTPYKLNASDTSFNRWGFTFANINELPYGFTQKANLTLTSDLLYVKDFPREVPGYGDPALDNRVSVTRNEERTHTSLDVEVFRNLLKENPVADNVDSVHRFPSIRHNIAERQIGSTPISFRLDSEYVNFARQDFAYDDVVGIGSTKIINTTRNSTFPGGADPGAGEFDPSVDLIRAGQRFDVQPEFSAPFMIGNMIDVLPTASLRYTQYGFDVAANPIEGFDRTPARTYVRAQIAARSLASHVYGEDSENPNASLYKHEIEPRIAVSTIPSWFKQSNHSFFGVDNSHVPAFREVSPVSDNDFLSGRGIQFDYEDRLPSKNVITFGLANRIIRKSWLNGIPEYRQVVNFQLSQSYDIDEAKKTTQPRYAWSDIAALLEVKYPYFETSAEVRYYPYHNATNTSARARVTNSGKYFEVRFYQNFSITDDLNTDYTNRQENFGLGGGYETKFVSFGGGIDFQPRDWQPISMKSRSWNADVIINPPGNCWSIGINVHQEIGGETTYRTNFGFNFGGEEQAPLMLGRK